MSGLQGLFFWGSLIALGVVMYVVAPRSKDEAGFFRGHDAKGRPASEWTLMMSLFISWIFAKSVTNAANLGATYGVVGSLAYAAYWLSIPLDEDEAISLISIAVDFGITQVVDGNWGVHAIVKKNIFPARGA